MSNFNGNTVRDDTVYVPAEQYMHLAKVIDTLNRNGVPIRDLQVAVGKGRLQLGDERGSYGVHMWDVRSRYQHKKGAPTITAGASFL